MIFEFVRARAASAPDAEAAIDGDVRLTNAAVAARVDEVARALLAAGVGRGDRVATLAPPSLDFWLTYLATTSIGAIWLGLNPRYQGPEYAYLLGDATPRVVFIQSPFEGRDYSTELQAVGPGVDRFVVFGEPTGRAVTFLEFLATGTSVTAGSLDAARDAVRPEDVAVIVYTSGTTGKPKGAMLSHGAIAACARANAEWMGDGLECALCAAPINHIGALNNVCMNVLAFGGRLIFHPRVDWEALARIGAREQSTFMIASPTTLLMLLATPGYDPAVPRSARIMIVGGAVSPRALLERWVPSGIKISNVYGQTETTGIISHTEFGDSIDVAAETLGSPIPGIEWRVAGAEGRPVAKGETGEIQVKGPYVMSGYFNRPEATAAAFTPDGFLRTGDLGVERADGRLAFVGRLKEMFKSGGYNVYPTEIEQVIGEHPSVEIAVVLAVPHELYQEVGHAFVQPKFGATVTGDELRTFLRSRIANYKIPKQFTVEPALPKLPNLKIDKQALRRRLDGVGA